MQIVFKILVRFIYTLIIFSIGTNIGFAMTEVNDHVGKVKFIENKKQWPASIIFSADLSSGKVYLKNNGFQYLLYDKEAIANIHLQSHSEKMYENGNEECFEEVAIAKHQYLVNFLNSNENPKILGNQPFPEYYNYFIGNNSSNWASKVKAYNTVLYKELYQGIDMRVYSSGIDLKYDLIINPGGNNNEIALEYEGLDEMYIYDGDLIIETSLGIVREQKPYAYQDIDGNHIPVTCNYVLECGVLSFEFPHGYDEQHPVVIDPLLIFSTYSGSNADNWGNTATPGENGKLYSGGITNHIRNGLNLGEFPATIGAFQTSWGGIWDVAIIKYDSSGSEIEYATYLGGSGSEVPHSMIMDNDENLIIMGSTNSTDFPTTSNGYLKDFQGGEPLNTILGETFINGSDIFIAKLSRDGAVLRGATYFGGINNDGQNRTGGPLTRNYGDQQRGEVFIDDDDDIYISSVTKSENLFDDAMITSFDRSYNGGDSDGILVKFDKQLENIVWGGYLGGARDDTAFALKVNGDGQVYVAGGTNSVDFITSTGSLNETALGAEDGFIALIDQDGSQIIDATYIGTSAYDQVYFLDLDENGNVYVLGQTRGKYPVTEGVYGNQGGGQFIHKLKPDLSSTMFSTVFGTTNRNEPNISLTAFLVSDCDNIYVTGWGNSQSNFVSTNYMRLNTNGLPFTSDAIRTTTTGDDFYLMVLDADAKELLYATFFGGGEALVHVDGGTSRFDKQGIVYHSVCASCIGGSSFPTTDGAWSNENRSGSGCNNAAFKFDLASLKARIQTNTIEFNAPGITSICFPEPIVFENVSIGGENFLWNFGDNSSEERSDKDSIIHEYQKPGRYVVTLTAIDLNTCLGIDITKLTVDIFESGFSVIHDFDICDGTELRLEAFGGTQYTWFNSDSSVFSSEQFPEIMPRESTKYYVRIIDENKKCELYDSVTVKVTPAVMADFEVSRNYDCMEIPKVDFVNLSENADEYIWEFGDGATSSESKPTHDYESGIYQLTLRARNEICSDAKTVTINTIPIQTYNVITPGFIDGANDFFIVESPLPVTLVIFNRWGKTVFESDDYQNNWSARGEPSGIYYYDVLVDGEQRCKGWVQVLK